MTVKISVDHAKCVGHAQCNAMSPKLFPLDDGGYVDITEAQASNAELAEARNGANACPERAITVSSS